MALSATKFDTKCADLWDKLTLSKGSLSFEQFSTALTVNGVNLSFDALKTQWDIIDTDGSNDMDLSEFKVLMKRHFEATDDKVILQNAFNTIYSRLFTNDPSDLLSYKLSNRRSSMRGNVKIVLNKRTIKQNSIFQTAVDREIKNVFKLIDVDNSGTLEFEEMWEAVKLLEIPISYDDLKLTYDFFDTDKDGMIEEDEFKRWMNSQITKYWDDGADNRFVALQRIVTSPQGVKVLSNRASQLNTTMFSFKDVIEEESEENDTQFPFPALIEEENEKESEVFELCTVSDVEAWDVDEMSDYIAWLFKGTEYDGCRDRYVAIFMTSMIDGKKFMKLGRRQISHLGIMTKKGKRHVSVIKKAQRQIKERSEYNLKLKII